MNIHITDLGLFNTLLDSSLLKIRMGSHLYGLSDSYSDTDYLCVTMPSRNQVFSFNKSIHQIQYKDTVNNIDFVFTDICSFFWNLLNGDSTINFEIMHSDDFKNSHVGKMFNEITKDLRTYNIIVAYLGFANRDVKNFWKEKTHRDKFKKLLHIERGLLFAKQIFYDYERFELKKQEIIDSKLKYSSLLEEKKENYDDFYKLEIEKFGNQIKEFRQNVVNKALENKELARFLNVNAQKNIDDIILSLSHEFSSKQENNIDLTPYYLVNENDLKYNT